MFILIHLNLSEVDLEEDQVGPIDPHIPPTLETLGYSLTYALIP